MVIVKKFLSKLQFFKERISFKNPSKSKIVIFDNNGSDIIRKAILYDIDHTILHARCEKVHITFQIFFLLMKNILKTDWNLKKVNILNLYRLLRQLYKVYLLSCIQYIHPSVVITFIDNSGAFQWCSRNDKSAEYFAIQNGIRVIPNVSTDLPHYFNVISMPHFFCYGYYEIELYRKFKHKIDSFHPMGSIFGSYYKANDGKKRHTIDFDLCLVVEDLHSRKNDDDWFELIESIVITNKFLSDYIDETGLSCCVAMRTNRSQCAFSFEYNYLKSMQYDKKACIIENDRDRMTTYDAMNRSRVVVTSCSSAALEAFGWGKKVLFNYLVNDNIYGLPWERLNAAVGCNYNVFKTKLDHLMKMDQNEYMEKTRDLRKLLMNNNPEYPAHTYIRNMILEHI